MRSLPSIGRRIVLVGTVLALTATALIGSAGPAAAVAVLSTARRRLPGGAARRP